MMGILKSGRRGLAVAAAVIAVAATGTVAVASAATPGPKPAAAYACEGSGHVAVQLTSTPSRACPAGTTSVILGAQGPAGPSGVISAATALLSENLPVVTGGSFVTNATTSNTVKLGAGTYELTLNAKVTPDMTSAVQVFPQFFVYDQEKNPSFAGDLFNVGAGALESGGNDQIDSYYSGTDLVTLAAPTTLWIYAFGYDSDRGSGSYTVDQLTMTVLQLNPATTSGNSVSYP